MTDDTELLKNIKYNIARLCSDCRDDYASATTLGAQFESAIASRTAEACLRIVIETINEYMETKKKNACNNIVKNTSGN